MKLNTKRALLAVAQVYEDHPRRFAIQSLARAKNGERRGFADNDAYSFCTVGIALRMEAEGLIDRSTYMQMMEALGGITSVIELNNGQGREAVIANVREVAAAISE